MSIMNRKLPVEVIVAFLWWGGWTLYAVSEGVALDFGTDAWSSYLVVAVMPPVLLCLFIFVGAGSEGDSK